MFGGLLNFVRKEIYDWWIMLMMILPGEIGSKVRLSVLPFKSVGKDVRFLRGGMVEGIEGLSIGDHTHINRFCHFSARGIIEIGSHVLIAPHVIIWAQNHEFRDGSKKILAQGYTYSKVVIEDDVWIAAGAIIVSGVRVGQGTVVGAGSVVTKNTEPYSIVVGSPAKKIGMRKK